MKVKRAISKCGGEISHVLSPKISLIVSDKVTNAKTTYPFNGPPEAGTRGYKILQKASELNRKANAENIEIMARKYDIAISTCEKFLASIKDRVSIDKSCNSEGVQEDFQKESKFENLTKTVKRIKSGLKLCKMAVRETNAVRFFNRKAKKIQTSSSTRIEQKLLEKNFIKVEDCSRQMRPLYKSNVFRKLVFCRCSCNVFHSAHVTETKPPKTTSHHPQARMKFLNLSGHCEICDWSFHCMWTRITGEMHKENVCQSSYSKIHDLISQLPSLDNFLNKYCTETNFTDTNAGDIRVQSSNGMPINRECEIECTDIGTVSSIVTSSLSPNKNEIDFNTTSSSKFNSEKYSQDETEKETLNPCETKAVPLYDQTDLAPLHPDQHVKLSTDNDHIFKCLFSEFLTEQMRKHLQFIHRKNDGNRASTQYHIDPLSMDGSRFYKNACIVSEDPMKAEILKSIEPYYKIFANLFNSLKCSNLNPVRKPETMYDVEVKCSNIANLKPHDFFCSFEIQKSQNVSPRKDLKLDITDNFYLPKFMTEYTDRVWSEIIKLLSIDSSLVNDTYFSNIYEILKHVESEKAEQNEIANSTEIEKMVKLFSSLPNRLFNFNYLSTQKTVTDDISRFKQSPKIEPVSDACNNSQFVRETSVMHKTKSWLNKSKMAKLEERRAAEVKNEMAMKELAMLKMNDKKKVRLKEKDVVLPECIVDKKTGMGKAKIKTEVKESMEQSDDDLAKYSYRNTLNTPRDQLESHKVHRKKLSQKEKFCLENSTCIPADSVKQLKGQKQESSSFTLAGSLSKRRDRKKLQSSTSRDENSSSFSVSSFSRKTDACTNRMYSSPLARSSSLCSYRRLDKLVIKKIEIPTVREISSPSVCIESRKYHSFSTTEKCACSFNIALQKKAYPADFRLGDATSDLGQRRATEDRNMSLDKQSNVSYSGAAGKVGYMNVQATYQAQKAFVSPQKSIQKTIINMKAKDTCSENWNIKFNRGLRMTLCRI